MTIEEQSNEIVEKYYSIVSGLKPNYIEKFKLIELSQKPFTDSFLIMANKCAITEVEAIIAENKANGVYEQFMKKWYNILKHLKQM
jgi:hypothetical protein